MVSRLVQSKRAARNAACEQEIGERRGWGGGGHFVNIGVAFESVGAVPLINVSPRSSFNVHTHGCADYREDSFATNVQRLYTCLHWYWRAGKWRTYHDGRTDGVTDRRCCTWWGFTCVVARLVKQGVYSVCAAG